MIKILYSPMKIEKNVMVYGDSDKIKQATLILLDNAAKYTEEKGKISVSLTTVKRQAVIRVTNMGCAIKNADLPHIFDRFYRADNSRNSESGGYGLGLSIAKTIVERSDGEIFAESRNGLNTFTIKLKLTSG